MGYHTSYSLEVKKYGDEPSIKEINLDEVIKKVKTGSSQEEILHDLEFIKSGKKNILITPEMIIEEFVTTHEYASYALTKTGGTSESCKWYDYNEELAKFSKKYPNWLFILSGEGEEAGDIWKNYYLNGKVQQAVAKITFDEFDEKKLKKVK